MRKAFLARATGIASSTFFWLYTLPARAADTKKPTILDSSGLNKTAASSDLGTPSSGDTAALVGKTIGAFIGLAGILLVVLFVYAGFLWMTAQGDEKKVETAKLIIRNAVIGTILMFSAYAIANTVATSITTLVQ